MTNVQNATALSTLKCLKRYIHIYFATIQRKLGIHSPPLPPPEAALRKQGGAPSGLPLPPPPPAEHPMSRRSGAA